ncbi:MULTISPECIES: GNAT family N-acetyltransferase [Kitasatospora]|uniref:GNAT family N-acetyltransferase n=1 Tax=Kitasatospora cathayae TaxID=3004092 RepID=A0ABY7QDB1_9ACTN|nr:GNAT family N-acetyltransferase [Kitasatospora sp. HUAS 3-15]WBP90582.1 GNAT family N-acetyltransferase [Kitasatospora sp. HUAS 3-15]
MTIDYQWRGALTDPELDTLHAEGFGHPVEPGGRLARLERHSLGWVTARRAADGALVGFVNLAWDGGAHAFVLDTVVSPAAQRQGIATRLVAEAADGARAAGCAWLHVDFEPHLRAFYLEACGLRPTDAGLLAL